MDRQQDIHASYVMPQKKKKCNATGHLRTNRWVCISVCLLVLGEYFWASECRWQCRAKQYSYKVGCLYGPHYVPETNKIVSWAAGEEKVSTYSTLNKFRHNHGANIPRQQHQSHSIFEIQNKRIVFRRSFTP